MAALNGAIEEEGSKELELLTKLTAETLVPLTAEQVVDQLIQSEEIYVKNVLEVAIRSFEKRLRNRVEVGKPIISELEINAIFLNLDSIYEFNKQFLDELNRLKYEGKVLENLGSRIIQFIPFFKVYAQYLRGHKQAATVFIGLAKNAKFAKFLKFNQLSAGVKLAALLSLPISRLPQYLVYLGALQEKITDATAQEDIGVAIAKIEEVTNLISDKVKDTTARQLVVTLQTQVFKNLIQIVAPSRFVVKQGTVKQVLPKRTFQLSKVKNVLLILFNDMLFWSTPGKAPQRIFRLENVDVVSVDELSGLRDAFGIRESRGKVLFIAANDVEQRSWLEELQNYSQQAKFAARTQKKVDPVQFEKFVLKRTRKEQEIVLGAARLRSGPGARPSGGPSTGPPLPGGPVDGAGDPSAEEGTGEDEMFHADEEMKAVEAALAALGGSEGKAEEGPTGLGVSTEPKSGTASDGSTDPSYSAGSGAYGDYGGYYSSYYGSSVEGSSDIAPTFSDYGPVDPTSYAATPFPAVPAADYYGTGYGADVGFSDEAAAAAAAGGYGYTDPAYASYYAAGPDASYASTAVTDASSAATGTPAAGYSYYAVRASVSYQNAVAAYDAATSAYDYASASAGPTDAAEYDDYTGYGAASGGYAPSSGGYESASGGYDPSSGGYPSYDPAYSAYYGYSADLSGGYAVDPSTGYATGAYSGGEAAYGGSSAVAASFSAAPSTYAPAGPRGSGTPAVPAPLPDTTSSAVFRPTPVIPSAPTPAEEPKSEPAREPRTGATDGPRPGFGFILPSSGSDESKGEVKSTKSILPRGPNPLALAAIAKLKTPRSKEISVEEKELIMKLVESDPTVMEMVMKDAELKEMVMEVKEQMSKSEVPKLDVKKPDEKRGSGKREDIIQRGNFLRKFDPKSNRFYYVNIKTKTSQWQPPPEFAEDKTA